MTGGRDGATTARTGPVATACPADAVLRTVDVQRSFRGVRALRGVSLGVRAGEIVGLIGPNGSGKTTLLNVISGVYPPSKGRVYLEEREISGRRPHVIARLGVGRTFQNIRLFGHLTVRQNVQVGSTSGRRLTGVDHAADVARLLERFHVSDVADHPAQSLPYGVQRRVEIARALAGRPLFLLLDEPAAGMNEAESDELLSVIIDVRDEFACGILIVDHDLRLIMRLCDRIHVLAEGETLAEGTPAEVRDDPQVKEVFLGEAPASG